MAFEDKFDRYGGIGFGILAVILLVAGVTYLVPLEDATKTTVYMSCVFGVVLLGFIMVPMGLYAIFVGAYKGGRDAIREARAKRQRQKERVAALSDAQRARYERSAEAPVYVDYTGGPAKGDRPQT